ncbi:MAG: TonB family protein, partial [Oleiharenicola lentus]
RGSAKMLRIVTFVLINADGSVANVRVLESSGNKYFDEIIIRDLREVWVFSPAVKKGRKVRCLVQQNVRVEWSNSSPFEVR